jgi:hypothetical protein
VLLPTRTPTKVNYLNNKDILKEIHLSKNSYCSFTDKTTDHQYDIILPEVSGINSETIQEARINRADRIKKETGEIIDPSDIPLSQLVFRVVCWDHIPLAPPKVPKAQEKKKKIDFFDFDVDLPDDIDALLESADPQIETQKTKYISLNFPPFYHYRLDGASNPYVVGKSHWRGDLEDGVFSKDHGQMTHKLATMFIKLCERYATRSNWRGYTYNDEMQAQALLQLSYIGLKFDESKSQNPFAYYTAAITNSFTSVLNTEKKNQNIRDDILEMNGLNPSWTRQNSGSYGMLESHGPSHEE